MRIYWEELNTQPGMQVGITGPEYHYAVNVMRCKVGREIRFFNPHAGEWRARIDSIHKHTLTCTIQTQLRPPLERTASLHLAVARLKPDAWGWMLEKATELGATHIHPIVSEHVQCSSWLPQKWHNLMKGAAQQCERLDVPELLEPVLLYDFLQNLDPNITWFAAIERIQAPHLVKPNDGNIGILVGPEGGFSETEKQWIIQSPCIETVSLGPNILRAETSALYALVHLVRQAK